MNRKYSPTTWVGVALAIGLVAGFGLGYMYIQPRVEDLSARLTDAEEKLSVADAEIDKLKLSLEEVRIEKSRLETLLSMTNASLATAMQELAAEKADLKAVLEDLRSSEGRVSTLEKDVILKDQEITALEEKISLVEEVLAVMDNDRKLLIQLRMELPETRNETLEYWSTVKDLAVQSDPSLGPAVDAITVNIDGYFNWLETRPSPEASLEETCVWFFIQPPEVIQYFDAIDIFQKDVYLSVITHIRSLTDLFDL